MRSPSLKLPFLGVWGGRSKPVNKSMKKKISVIMLGKKMKTVNGLKESR